MLKPFFYIIPRTSSTSLTKFLKTCFGPDKVFVRKVVEDIFDGQPVTSKTKSPSLITLKEDLKNHHKFKAFVIMAPFGAHRFIDDDLSLYVTLRDPVERCLSLIRFMRMNSELNSINKIVWSFGNDYSGMLKEQSLISLRDEQTRMMGNVGTWEMDHSELLVAKQNLKTFTKVIDFANSSEYRRIARSHGVFSPPEYPSLNSAQCEISINSDQLNLLERVNSLDRSLYEHFCKQKGV